MRAIATTILKHLKEGASNPSAHLKNSIRYILNPKKTEGGLWTGGNVGTDAGQAYQAMMDTKTDWQKFFGRQGYHYVISFAPGEADEKTAYKVGKEFCEQYLGQDYDYVFAVHNDQHHMHIHLVFNSVNRMDGYKYRYVEGDWEKKIQPITDHICEKYGLSRLEYDAEKKVGKSYAEHLANVSGRMTNTKIIRADIDHAVSLSGNFEEFLSAMRKMGYKIRSGFSERLGKEYIAYTPPGLKGRRDYHLGAGYSGQEIRDRIAGKLSVNPQELPALRFERFKGQSLCGLQKCYVLRVVHAISFHQFDEIQPLQSAVRKDLLHINQLTEECEYMIEQNLTSTSQIEEKLENLKQSVRALKNQNDAQKFVYDNLPETLRPAYHEYRKICGKLQNEELTDEEFESLQDRQEELEEKCPQFIEIKNDSSTPESMLNEARREIRICRRILKNAEETMRTYELRPGGLRASLEMQKKQL